VQRAGQRVYVAQHQARAPGRHAVAQQYGDIVSQVIMPPNGCGRRRRGAGSRCADFSQAFALLLAALNGAQAC